MKTKAPTQRTQLHRYPSRGSHDKEVIDSILDQSFLCHISYLQNNEPRILPMAYARKNNRLIIHGAKASPAFAAILSNPTVAIAVTLLDDLILTKSAFNHSVNYRSVVIFAKPIEIQDPQEKQTHLHDFVEFILPGRMKDVRKTHEAEVEKTVVIGFDLSEASAKLRSGDPIEEPQDITLPLWSGTIPLQQTWGTPKPHGEISEKLPQPKYTIPSPKKL